jgi:hypothetical protein
MKEENGSSLIKEQMIKDEETKQETVENNE